MKVVVTGGAGFIGANLCRELAAHPGVTGVLAVDDLSTGAAANLVDTGVPLVRTDIRDRSAIEDVIDGCDAVVHLAARPSVPRSLVDPVATHTVNAGGTVNVLEACRRRSIHVVAASSSSVYGATAVSPKHEDLPTRPLSPYGASKLAAEAYVLAYGTSYDLPVLPLRFFNVYGPLQSAGHAYAAVVPAFIDAALRGEPLRIHGDGRQTRDFTYVGTVVRVLIDAVVRRVTSLTPVNLAFGTRTSVRELADRVAAAAGVSVDIRREPPRASDVRHSQAAADLLRRLFPEVVAVPLDVGLKETVDWFRRGRRQFITRGEVPDQRGATARA